MCECAIWIESISLWLMLFEYFEYNALYHEIYCVSVMPDARQEGLCLLIYDANVCVNDFWILREHNESIRKLSVKHTLLNLPHWLSFLSWVRVSWHRNNNNSLLQIQIAWQSTTIYKVLGVLTWILCNAPQNTHNTEIQTYSKLI